MPEHSPVTDLARDLLKSHWPKCDDIARVLVRIGTDEAKQALIAALRAKRHHIRTAAIRSLVALGDGAVVALLEQCLDDPSYETRMEAKAGMLALTGREVKTGRGE